MAGVEKTIHPGAFYPIKMQLRFRVCPTDRGGSLRWPFCTLRHDISNTISTAAASRTPAARCSLLAARCSPESHPPIVAPALTELKQAEEEASLVPAT